MNALADITGGECYLELPGWERDQELLAAASACIALQRRLAAPLLPSRYQPDSTRGAVVSAEALAEVLQAGCDVHGVASHRDVTNAIVFNSHHIAGAVHNRAVARLRRRLDRLVAARARRELQGGPWLVRNSGHFWYPPGGYMGWHTNSGDPGWRLYVTFADQPGQSFFRYRHPQTGQITTSLDTGWNFRLFRISPQAPLWHAVYSQTDRYSMGFMIRPWSLAEYAAWRWNWLQKRLLPGWSRRRAPSTQPAAAAAAPRPHLAR